MAIVRLALSNPAANTDTLAHTAVRQSLVSVIATNKSTTAATVRIWIKPDGATTVSQYAFLAYDTVLPPNNSLETFRVALEVDDELYVRSSTADVSFSVNAVHESSGNYNKVFVQEAMPTASYIGDVWVSEALGYVKFWDGTTWVNAVPGSAGFAQTSEPLYPQEGQLWVDLDNVPTTEPGYPTVIYSPTQPTGLDLTDAGTIWTDGNDNSLNIWNGTSWVNAVVTFTYASSAPSTPVLGQVWMDSDDTKLYVYNGTSWIQAITLSTYASTQPSSPTIGQLWVNSTSRKMFVYSGSTWVEAAPLPAYASSSPSSPVAGQIWVDSSSNIPYIYSGSSWTAIGSQVDSDQNILAGQVFR